MANEVARRPRGEQPLCRTRNCPGAIETTLWTGARSGGDRRVAGAAVLAIVDADDFEAVGVGGDEDSAAPSVRYDAAVGQRTLGFPSKRIGDLKRSEALLRRSISIQKSLSPEHPARPEYRQQHRLGHADRARASRESAGTKVAETPKGQRSGVWIDWVPCAILCREAEQLLAK